MAIWQHDDSFRGGGSHLNCDFCLRENKVACGKSGNGAVAKGVNTFKYQLRTTERMGTDQRGNGERERQRTNGRDRETRKRERKRGGEEEGECVYLQPATLSGHRCLLHQSSSAYSLISLRCALPWIYCSSGLVVKASTSRAASRA